MSEEIGKHKGAVETLLHEKKELSRILNIVNSQLQRHLTALEEEGVDTEEFINDLQEQGQQQRKQKQQGQKKRSQKPQRKSQKQAEGEDEFDLSGHLE